MRGGAALVLAVAMIVIGIAMIVRTVAAGGGATAFGIVVGVLLIAAGAGRAWLERSRT